MEDPFVKRMMERTKARNKVLGRVTVTEKRENFPLSEDVAVMETAIVSSPKRKSLTAYATDKSEDICSFASKTKTSTPISTKSVMSSLSPSKMPHTQPLISSPRKRFNKLAMVSQRLEEWEDDYKYHSVCGGVAEEVESNAVNSMHAVDNVGLIENVLKSQRDLLNGHHCKFSPTEPNYVSPPKSKYFFGEATSIANNEEGLCFLTKNISAPHAHQSPSNTSYHTAKSSLSSLSSPSFRSSIVASPIPFSAKDTSQSKSISQSNVITPTKQLAWDKQLLKSLEAQGFTPSESKSKLSYDFERDRSPLKEKSNDNTNERKSDFLGNQPPKIVSYLAKSPGSSPQKKRPNRTSSPVQHRSRDQSPSKVSDLRSRWEQHIQDSSPERQQNSSPERQQENIQPDKKITSLSPTRKSSQSKIVQQAPPKSPTKSYPILPNLRTPLSSDSSKSCGNIAVSHHKMVQADNIVKGFAPMPETTSVIKNPSSSSVKDKIAAFSAYKGPAIVKKDPAELSLQDRKNIFEKRKGSALIPKAPFAQNAPSKSLHSLVGSNVVASQGLKINQTEKLPSKINQTYICEPTGFKEPSLGNKLITNGSKSFETQRRHFECDNDEWSSADTAKNIGEIKQDMKMLYNRFPNPQHHNIAVLQKEEETESEYPQSDESSEFDIQSCGPPKPPRAVEESTKCFAIPQIVNYHSPSKRMNSTELGEANTPSPRKEYIPRVKPGCLFPSLSDIESHSEAADSQDDEDDKESSFAESILTCASIDSLGKQIQKIAQPICSDASRLTTFSEDFEGATSNRSLLSGDSALEAIAEIDDALDEAFSDDDPTPPKRRKDRDYSVFNSFKTPKVNESDSSEETSENSLAHSISMYRKQKPAEVHYTPVRQLIRKSRIDSPSIDSPVSPSVDISARIRVLQEEEELQLTVISQASSAINVVSQQSEQQGTPQHIEAEKLLLIATKKRQAALDEIQRLKAEGALGKRNHWTQDEDSCRGSISISNIALPLKQSFLNKELKEYVHHLLVLVKHRDQVITSQMQKTPGGIIEGAISFPNLMSLHNLAADFNISLEVYCFKSNINAVTQHKKDFKKEHSRMILTPLKRLQKESRMASPVVQSPGGPYSVRSSSFALIGFANLNINTLTRNAWTLEKVPYASPLDGHLLMRVSVSMEGGVIERSFLTMFEDVGGFGAWNRRWCVLAGPFLRYWCYPDDETKKDCIGYLDLRMCTTRKVELVTRDVCARQFTFELTTVRPATKTDKTDLVHEVRHNTVISRILLSADSKEERILWCNKLNKALANIRAWDPDALRPEDYHV